MKPVKIALIVVAAMLLGAFSYRMIAGGCERPLRASLSIDPLSPYAGPFSVELKVCPDSTFGRFIGPPPQVQNTR